MPPTPRKTPSPTMKSHVLEDGSPLQRSIQPTQFTGTTTLHPSITTSPGLDFQEDLHLLEANKSKYHYKANSYTLKRDLEINASQERLFPKTDRVSPPQQTSFYHTISTDKESANVGSRSQLIRTMPDWLLSNNSPVYDLKKYLSPEVHSVLVDIVPNNGILQFNAKEWVMSHDVSKLECHQFTVTIHAYGDMVEDHNIFFAYNDIDPIPFNVRDYKGISLPFE